MTHLETKTSEERKLIGQPERLVKEAGLWSVSRATGRKVQSNESMVSEARKGPRKLRCEYG